MARQGTGRFVVLGAAAALTLLLAPPHLAQPCQGDPLCIVTQERAKHPPQLDHAQVPDLLRAITARLNAEGVPDGPFGLLVKTSGANCGGYSCDIVCAGQGDQQRQWDVFTDVDGAARPAWGRVQTIAVRPCELGAAPPPPPPPPPSCAECEADNVFLRQVASELRDELDVKARRVTDLEAELDATRTRALDAERRVQQLEEKLNTVRCSFSWRTFACRVVK